MLQFLGHSAVGLLLKAKLQMLVFISNIIRICLSRDVCNRVLVKACSYKHKVYSLSKLWFSRSNVHRDVAKLV